MSGAATISAFHAHVYFDPATQPAAAALREALAASFSVPLGRWHDGPIGPHTKGNCEVRFPVEQLGAVVAWLMLRRGELSVLIHPLTGDVLADHATYPMWLGEQVPLDLEVLRAYLEAENSKTA